MAQMELPESLALFPGDEGRLILQILINCGLRLKDARKLPYDALTLGLRAGSGTTRWHQRRIGPGVARTEPVPPATRRR